MYIMFIIDEIWREIKSYLFHNIKIHGKHLKDCKINKNYNATMKEFSNNFKKTIHIGGPKILYKSKKRSFPCVKLFYGVPRPSFYSKNTNIYSIVIETIHNFIPNHIAIKNYYLNNI